MVEDTFPCLPSPCKSETRRPRERNWQPTRDFQSSARSLPLEIHVTLAPLAVSSPSPSSPTADGGALLVCFFLPMFVARALGAASAVQRCVCGCVKPPRHPRKWQKREALLSTFNPETPQLPLLFPLLPSSLISASTLCRSACRCGNGSPAPSVENKVTRGFALIPSPPPVLRRSRAASLRPS